MIEIHSTSIIHPKAQIAQGVKIGPFCQVGEGVSLAEGVELDSYVQIEGQVEVGKNSKIWSFCSIGLPPQHLKYKSEPTRVKIGEGVTLREYVSVHRGTAFGSGLTEVGDHVYLMAYCHVGHDVTIGRKAVLANGIQLAGHAQVGDGAFIGGMSGVTQHVRVGAYTYVGAHTIVRQDLTPFVLAKGSPARLSGINKVGLARAGFSKESVEQIKKIYRVLYLKHLPLNQALHILNHDFEKTDELKCVLDFLKSSPKGYAR